MIMGLYKEAYHHSIVSLMPHPSTWLLNTPQGLYCEPGGFHIDPFRPVEKAVITHGHSDHARPGNGAVLGTPETLAISQARYGERAGLSFQPVPYRQPVRIHDVTVTLYPAGHILGSSQVLLEYRGSRVVISGDYKRAPDPTCEPFEPVPCDVFITEATFGLPVFTHPPAELEVQKLLDSLETFPERCHVVGVYALGKCQRVMMLLRQAGYDRQIYVHGGLIALSRLYEHLGKDLGPWSPVAGVPSAALRGSIVLAPPSATSDRWSRRLPDALIALASGWMRVRARARQKQVELPLVISDHADWPELTQTLTDVGAPEVWVTHGEEEALIHCASKRGFTARALRLIGYGDEGEEAEEPAS